MITGYSIITPDIVLPGGEAGHEPLDVPVPVLEHYDQHGGDAEHGDHGDHDASHTPSTQTLCK